MTARRRAVAIVVCGLSCALAGCGGDSQTDTKPVVGDAFAKRAVVVCQKALTSKQAWRPFPVSKFDPMHPDRSALPKVAPWLEQQVAPTFDAWLSGLRGLGQPNTGRDAWHDTVDAVARIDRDNLDQLRAAEHGDTKGFAAATADLHDLQGELERATAAAGVPACAAVHAG